MTVFHPFSLHHGNPDADAALLGGKGAGLSRMAAKGYPVPPGFTIDTTVCAKYQQDPVGTIKGLMTEVTEHALHLKNLIGWMPLLSVRSGAPISMPGMMDTILNVGLTTKTLPEWKERIGERAAYDSYRRLLQMLGSTALGIDHKMFELNIEATKKAFGVKDDHDMTAEAWKSVAKRHWTTYQNATQAPPPDTIDGQLRFAIGAVFRSWTSERAVLYREMEKIPHDIGTAVTVQAMVFGNMNDNSGSGVLFTRDPSTGQEVILGEYLTNAQGEDVVAGIRTPEKLVLSSTGGWKGELFELCHKLEGDYRDMVDIEFTVQNGKLFLLQSRAGKRTAKAAFRIAVEQVEQGLIDRSEMYSRVKASQYAIISRPQLDPAYKVPENWKGIAASPGVVTGRVVFSSKDAVAATEPCILVSKETTPDDIAGMNAAVGVLTQTGGATSHAAVVARGMNKPCVVGVTELQLPGSFAEGQEISICGASGRVWAHKVPVVDAGNDAYVDAFFEYLFEDHGFYNRSVTPGEQTVVSLVDWMALPDPEVGNLLVAAKARDDQGLEVVFDATDPEAYGDENDEIVWQVFGEPPERQAFAQRIIRPLALHSWKHAKFIARNPSLTKALEKSGMQQIPTVNTLTELMQAFGTVTLSPTAAMVIDQEAMRILTANEVINATLFGKALSRADAAFAVLPAA